jgi:signal transduction histidine kinase/DNA-binding response OmpR family regulator
MTAVLAVAGGTLLGAVWGTGAVPDWAVVVPLLVGAGALGRHLGQKRRRTVAERAAEAAAQRVAAARAEAERAAQAVAVTPAQLDDERARLMGLMSDLGLALVVTDPAGGVLASSAMANELLQLGEGAPRAALEPSGTFFGLPLEDALQLTSLHRFFSSDLDVGEGVVTFAGTRRHIYWAGRALTGGEGFGRGRLFMVRDVTPERRFEVMKSDFLATVSHELRTPLTSLRGSLQLVLSRADALGAMDRELLSIGIKNTERLIRLINDLLDVDHLEQGTLAFRSTSLDVQDLVRAALESTRPAFEERRVRVKAEIGEGLPSVHGDRERLAQVLANLLDNAAHFSPAGSVVTLRAHARDAGLQIDVVDQGSGIPEAERPHVFERFWRADRGGTDAGAGLGLAICRAIVNRHGGRIWLESIEQHGSTFSIYLPRSIFRQQAGEVEPAPVAAPAGARILMVEDDPDTRAVTRASLEMYGYEVIEAGTGAHAVQLARREAPAAVLLDLVLPDISGYDVLRILKNSPETRDVPVVVLSVDHERELARRLGAFDALQKPAHFEQVRWSLAHALRRARRPDGRLVLGLGPAVSRDLTVLARVLEDESHEVYRGPDVASLASWSAANYPDLLVLDDDILSETQSEVTEILRHPTATHGIPLVFLTSERNGESQGAQWVRLQKPISKGEFLQAVQRLLTGGA